MNTVVFAGGGTGGHVFPAIALAKYVSRVSEAATLFVGSARGLEARLVPEHGYPLEILPVEPMRGGGAKQVLVGGISAMRTSWSALSLLRKVKPSLVLSVGGYAAGPVSSAALVLRIPLAVLEPNSVFGVTNRVLSHVATRVYVAYRELEEGLSPKVVRRFGVPVRETFQASPYVPGPSRRVLVLGGSQGAEALNERLPDALAKVREKIPELRVFHQTGKGRERAVRERYGAHGFQEVDVLPFVDDVAARLRDADLVVARAGAVTLSEISAVGRPSLLIPYPYAAGDHQAKNALALGREGASVMIRQEDADIPRLSGEIVHLLSDPSRRKSMADEARMHGRPHATSDIGDDLLSLAKIPRRRAPEVR